ncbi:hypothetical protein CFN78_21240 [Amycolatopsis antarctica]|uniref:Uncharacterized protein n=1 Tax=Amycolatopsis antarctica TaxID=1854586 RepID=A0A263D1C1_9PSEU|nr:DUF5708 family protein [Amycolatopsis antarctica]OZM71316.1 hypothetical protein CFN78_21240 [Amycolatopsis antarctica]
MDADKRALFAGASMVAIGSALRLTTGEVPTPMVSLPKIGLVLLVLGVLEIAGTLIWMAWPGKARGR